MEIDVGVFPLLLLTSTEKQKNAPDTDALFWCFVDVRSNNRNIRKSRFWIELLT